ncbi:S1 domain-containing RNA-binding protein [Paucilactobacillus suebicus]|uniref:S1 RNA-binding domain-containing protein n=1 Tax=Paucilactobacillus suebicus DSM 5007 = KCTC 3549 TaxID=1423807 RepID=A0A0R1VWC3_9LACO|nr:S1 domain-containing RNA-binding protein [Paucilactobacillus suebicus]KRM09741.1 S1 RNA-binding domain-containing protein [Paucilactobacillus suebicus DSM 5007 = KCTC 3549]
MAIEVGAKVSGKVSGITNFGAFVDLDDHKTGLVHISQVSNKFVKDIHDVLSVGDTVSVKVMSIGDDGKIALSIKAASDEPHQNSGQGHGHHDHADHGNNGGSYHNNHHDNNHHDNGQHHQSAGRPVNNNYRDHNNSNHNNSGHEDFDSLLSGFLKESESRLSTLRRNTEGKRGGRGGRRS